MCIRDSFGLALWAQSVWIGIMAGFILINCWGGLRQGMALARVEKLPRREGFACPSCHSPPPAGELWRCGKCGKAFDIFLTLGACPHCASQFTTTRCLDCGESSPIHEWNAPLFRSGSPSVSYTHLDVYKRQPD